MFKNLTKTLLKQHQCQLGFDYENYYFQRFEVGPLKMKTIDSLEVGDLVCEVSQLDACSAISTTSWVRNVGTEYQIGLFICTGTHNDLPVFMKICNIIIHEPHAFIICSSVNTIYFGEHFLA